MLAFDSGESNVLGRINATCHKGPREKEKWCFSKVIFIFTKDVLLFQQVNASGSDKYMYSYNPCQTFRLGPPNNNSCYFRDVALSCFDYFLMMCRGVAKIFQRGGHRGCSPDHHPGIADYIWFIPLLSLVYQRAQSYYRGMKALIN